MRMSVSDSAVSMRMGTSFVSRSDRVSSMPVSPGIMTSRIKQIKVQTVQFASGLCGAGGDRYPIAAFAQILRQEISNPCVVVDDKQMCGVVVDRMCAGLAASVIPVSINLPPQFLVDHCFQEAFNHVLVLFADFLQAHWQCAAIASLCRDCVKSRPFWLRCNSLCRRSLAP